MFRWMGIFVLQQEIVEALKSWSNNTKQAMLQSVSLHLA
jgi:hypothetical protein